MGFGSSKCARCENTLEGDGNAVVCKNGFKGKICNQCYNLQCNTCKASKCWISKKTGFCDHCFYKVYCITCSTNFISIDSNEARKSGKCDDCHNKFLQEEYEKTLCDTCHKEKKSIGVYCDQCYRNHQNAHNRYYK